MVSSSPPQCVVPLYPAIMAAVNGVAIATANPMSNPVETRKTELTAIPTVRVSETVLGQETHVVCQDYTDRICVFVSQVGKIGCLVSALLLCMKLLTRWRNAGSSLCKSRQIQANISTPAHYQPMPARLHEAGEEPSSIPSVLPSTSLSPLFGAPPQGYQTLYSLYASHISSTIVSARARGRQPAHASAAGESVSASLVGARPIIIGLGLKRLSEPQSTQPATDSVDLDFEEQEMSETEGERFRAILALVGRAATQLL